MASVLNTTEKDFGGWWWHQLVLPGLSTEIGVKME